MIALILSDADLCEADGQSAFCGVTGLMSLTRDNAAFQ
jgi:hypothetical protein